MTTNPYKKENDKFIKDSEEKYIVYFIYVEDNIIKFGKSDKFKERFKDHLKQYKGHNIKIIKTLETSNENNEKLENEIKKIFKKYIVEKKYTDVEKELINLKQENFDEILTKHKNKIDKFLLK